MINDVRILGLITARGGSKRLPRKNILDFAGKPLIAWSIEAALKSKYMDSVVTSTDDLKIRDVALKYGSHVPFARPEVLASDDATSIDVVIHAIKELRNQTCEYDCICLLQPTSPFRNERHIDRAIEYMIEKKADSVISVTEVDHPPEWAQRLPADNSMKSFFDSYDKIKSARTRDQHYRINGAIYLANVERVLEEKAFVLENNCYAFVMDRSDSADIDSQFDLDVAEMLMEQKVR